MSAFVPPTHDGYFAYHAQRYKTLLELIDRHSVPEARILDIGRSPFVTLLHERLGRSVDTMGFEPEGQYPEGFHYRYNLNDSQYLERWRKDLPQYDTIIMAEVIEHLYTSPLLVLNYLRSLLKDGGILIVQTPNAVALHKRIKMVAGRNPYEQIRTVLVNPGHFREYTAAELRQIGSDLGLKVVEMVFGNYFDYRYRPVDGHHPMKPAEKLGAINWLFRFLPGQLKPGITMVYRK
ncbi:class I SAM-dependent methyltransferase [Larkinella soli]|uniref:class I SAM-dependent methyltransferase n=1 Tax=Larkinella soli TaxID=1770527 RepID=UPI000FFC0A47|nr:methyltransferase domain-containing protein [Larkinella soli]